MQTISEQKVADTGETLGLDFGNHGTPPSSRKNTNRAAHEGVMAAKQAAELNWAKLTFRELQIVDLVADGRMSKEIAAELGISIRTVETHRVNIYRKLGIQSMLRLCIAVWATRTGGGGQGGTAMKTCAPPRCPRP